MSQNSSTGAVDPDHPGPEALFKNRKGRKERQEATVLCGESEANLTPPPPPSAAPPPLKFGLLGSAAGK